MPNAMFSKGQEAFLEGKVNWVADTIRAALCEGAPNVEKDEFLSQVKTVVLSDPLKGKSVEGAIGKAKGGVRFQGGGGQSATCMVIFKDTGDPKSSHLLVHVDGLGQGKFPIALNSGDVSFEWPSGGRIFRV